MLDSINEYIKTWNYNRQSIGEGENETLIPQLLQRIEDGYYKTKEIKLNLEIYNLSVENFKCDNLFDFLTHYKLVENASLRYPIIINSEGQKA